MKQGLLITNLGTPSSLDLKAVAKYLRQFLMDKRVIDLPWIIRFVLVNFLIIPFRSKKTLQAYQEIWMKEGSPLFFNSEKLQQVLQNKAGDLTVVLGMRYGTPSIEHALNQLKDCDVITILPLYPQYSSAATGSTLEEILGLLARWERVPSLKVISQFYQHIDYIKVQAQRIKAYLPPNAHLLFSYHGIPERQIKKTGCHSVCETACPPVTLGNSSCYRAQCFETSRLLAQELALAPEQYSTSFQSRLGKTPWIKPYTDQFLVELYDQGIKDIVICSPSFIADCLETLEELGQRLEEQWLEMGGNSFQLVPCLNDSPDLADAILSMSEN